MFGLGRFQANELFIFRFREKTAEELDKEVEYVMDDLDYAWLKMYNLEHRTQKCLPEVSNKVECTCLIYNS